MVITDFLRRVRRSALFSLGLLLALQTSRAGSASWDPSPVSGDWNTAVNWTPQIVPTDVAQFNSSNITQISITNPDAEIDSVVFNPGASAFTISADSHGALTFRSIGITNNSGQTQHFLSVNVSLFFPANSSAGDQTSLELQADQNFSGLGLLYFEDASSAGSSTITTDGASSAFEGGGGLQFDDQATADAATIVNEGGDGAGATPASFFTLIWPLLRSSPAAAPTAATVARSTFTIAPLETPPVSKSSAMVFSVLPVTVPASRSAPSRVTGWSIWDTRG